MSLQNRVNPYGDICFSEAKGNLMGNRGCLHNNEQEITRQYQLKRWITCLLEYKGNKREVMSKGKYTELFFWDEATAFAAGHRPCAECQPKRYKKFKETWQKANMHPELSAQELDDILHKERLEARKNSQSVAKLPNGCFVEFNKKPYLVFNNEIYRWSFNGYSKQGERTGDKSLLVLTPHSILKTFYQGFEPRIIRTLR